MNEQIAWILGLLITTAGNTAIFIWRLVSFRDAMMKEIRESIAHVVNQMTVMKSAIDVELDMMQKELNRHQLKVAEEYLRKDSFHLGMNEMKATTQAALGEVKAAVSKLDDKISEALETGKIVKKQ